METLTVAWTWIWDNKEWVFSGVGIVALTMLFGGIRWITSRPRETAEPSTPPDGPETPPKTDVRESQVNVGDNQGNIINVAGDMHIGGDSFGVRHEHQRDAIRAQIAEDQEGVDDAPEVDARSADAKRQRDRELIERLFRNVGCFAIEEVLDELEHRRVYLDRLWYFDWLREFRDSSEFHFYDEELKNAIDDMAALFDAATSHSEIFEEHPQDSNLYRVVSSPTWMTRGERDGVLDQLFDEVKRARQAHRRVLDLIRERFPEISLHELDSEARRRHAERLHGT